MTKGIIEEIIATLQKGAIRTLDGIIEFWETCTTEWRTAVEEYGGLGRLMQDVWNVENKVADTLSLKEVVDWLKGHLPKDKCRACMTVLAEELMDGEESALPLHYYVCFLDDKGEILLDRPQVFFHCEAIDAQLEENFDGKDMIVFD